LATAPGVNFTNILQADFIAPKYFANIFFVVCSFLAKGTELDNIEN